MITDIVNILLYFLLFLWVVVIPSLQYFLFNKENGSYIEYITDVKEYNLFVKLIYVCFYTPTILYIIIYWGVNLVFTLLQSIGRFIVNRWVGLLFIIPVIVLLISIWNSEEIFADFEDRELSHNFIKNNIEKFEYIDYLNIYKISIFGKLSDDTLGNVVIIGRQKEYSIGVIKECNITMSVNSSQLLLDKNDIDKYGKEHMYLVAENCLNKVYNILEKDKLIK